jgi:hypothetical protein
MRLYVKATYKVGVTPMQQAQQSQGRSSFRVSIDGLPTTVSFTDGTTMEALCEAEVSNDLYKHLTEIGGNVDEWSEALQSEYAVFGAVPDRAFSPVHEVLKYVLRQHDIKERIHQTARWYSSDGVQWDELPFQLMMLMGPSTGYSLHAALDQSIQTFLDNDRHCFMDALRHLHQAYRPDLPRYSWIDCTIAAELAIKEFLIRYRPEWKTLLTEVPSPPLHKLYGTVLEDLTGEKSPVLKELAKGAEIRNRLIHRPGETVSTEEASKYFMDVETAIFHLLTHLYPDDELIKAQYQHCKNPVRMRALPHTTHLPPLPPASTSP